ncbi:PucR family transcriptional regulator [Tsukamurella soli]|uniref:PucR family transcriptional regulator n=1 Tax=Tsukamurella soli TaxID=644556 RepID=A0ABP8JM78_9ACTN
MDAAARWLADFSCTAATDGGVEGLADLVDGEILAAVPEFAADESLRRDLHACTRGHWREFIVQLEREHFEPRMPVEATDLARTMIMRGYDMGVLLAGYRAGQRAVWGYITAVVERRIEDPDVRTLVLVRFWERTSRWLDHSVEQIIATYDTERLEFDRITAARRGAKVRAIVGGEPVDLDAASSELGYRLRGAHTAYVIWADDEIPDAAVERELERSAATVAETTGARGRLTVESGTRSIWMWAAASHAVDSEAGAIRPHVHLAVGGTYSGGEGFVRSHREALAAQALSGATGHARPIVGYRDVEISCIATGLAGPWAVSDMVSRELGELSGADEGATRIRGTLLRYLANQCNAARTAAQMNVHPNTVRYRIRQAEQSLGHPIDTRRVYVELSLLVLDTFGTVEAIPAG